MSPPFDGPDVAQLPLTLRAKISVLANGCWEWTGARSPGGHGNAYLAGKFLGAHRLVYALLIGEIEAGLVLHHRCEHPWCVNPTHLTPMTRKQHAAQHGLSGVAVENASKTLCLRGHELTQGTKQRVCRTCHNESVRAWYYRKKEA